MIESIMTFFKGDELFAVTCILPLAIGATVFMMRALTRLTLSLIARGKSGKECHPATDYHKDITTELFVPPTQIDTPY